MLSPNKSSVEKCSEGLLECCNKQRHMQMLLHEDLQQPPSMEKYDSKLTTESSASSNQKLFRGSLKKPFTNKISLIQRRNSMNVKSPSKKQNDRLSNFNQEIKEDNRMSLINHHLSPSRKKESLSIFIDKLHKKQKISLRQEKQSSYRPFLVSFSHMEDFCDSNGNLLQFGSQSIIQNLNEFNSSLMIDFKQAAPRHPKEISLKLGQNIPIHKSQFNITNGELTKRSEVL